MNQKFTPNNPATLFVLGISAGLVGAALLCVIDALLQVLSTQKLYPGSLTIGLVCGILATICFLTATKLEQVASTRTQ